MSQEIEGAFRTPSGRPTRHQYVYVDSGKDIIKGDVVKLGNVRYFVLLGLGSQITNPSVRLVRVSNLESIKSSIVSKLEPNCTAPGISCQCRGHKAYRQYFARKMVHKLTLRNIREESGTEE